MSLEPGPDETLDRILLGTIALIQGKRGYRTAMDSPLLAWFAAQHQPEARTALDLGAGTGLVSLVLGRALPQLHLQLLEKQPLLLDRARRNLLLNGLEMRAEVIAGDVADPPNLQPVQVVVCNPPYLPQTHAHPPLDTEKRLAHRESTATLRQFAQLAEQTLLPKGQTFWIFPALEAPRLLDTLAQVGLHDRAVQRVLHRPQDPSPARILVMAERGIPSLRQLPDRLIHLQDQEDKDFHPQLHDFLVSLRRETSL